ncbi:hypothetical protein BVX97_03245 [bacterium E08(2017)]|nr:hypothetical protein BVX97_03245 [bacterium E08(2017)]
MRIAVPVKSGVLAGEFRTTREFLIVEVDPFSGEEIEKTVAFPPSRSTVSLAEWLYCKGIHVIICCDMAHHTQAELLASGIEVFVGAPQRPADELVAMFLRAMPRESVNV